MQNYEVKKDPKQKPKEIISTLVKTLRMKRPRRALLIAYLRTHLQTLDYDEQTELAKMLVTLQKKYVDYIYGAGMPAVTLRKYDEILLRGKL